MEAKPLVLIFDIGSQSTRAFLFDKEGKVIDKKKVEYPPFETNKPGYSEIDPNIFFESICQTSKQLYESNLELWDNIIGVSVTTIRDTPVFLDEDYNVIRNSMMWMDQRVAKCNYRFPFFASLGMRLVGLYPTARAQAKQTRSNWLIEKEKENWDKTKHYWLLSTFLNYKMTSKGVDSPSNLIGHIPYDYKKNKYYGKKHMKYKVFNIEKEKLPKIIPTGSIIGYINEETSRLSMIKEGLPLIASGSDKGCETVGTGACFEGMASISFGTASSIQLTTKKYVEPITFLPSYPSVIPNQFNPEIQIYRGFWMISWFKRQFAQKETRRAYILDSSAEEMLNLTLLDIPPGAQGLIMHPYWGPMLKYPEARGSFIGFSDYHTKQHVYRAIIEGIGFELYKSLLQLEKKTKQKIHTITVSGGGSQSDIICQINADILGVKVVKVHTYETSGLGAAIATFTALKEYENFDLAIKNMVHYEKEYLPNPKTHKLYKNLYNHIYKKVYPRIKKFYKIMPSILENDEIE